MTKRFVDKHKIFYSTYNKNKKRIFYKTCEWMIKRISVLYKDVKDILFQWWRLWSWWWWCEKRVEIRFFPPRWIMDKKFRINSYWRILLTQIVLKYDFKDFWAFTFTNIMQFVKFYMYTLFSTHTMNIIMNMNRVNFDYSENSHNQNFSKYVEYNRN